MKKYFAAAIVAVMVFAFSAFAAELNVNGGVLQAGSDNDLTCADSAEVSFTTGWVGQGDDLSNEVTGVTVTFDEGCNGNAADVTILEVPPTDGYVGNENIGSQRLAQGIKLINDNAVSWSLPQGGIAIEEVGRVNVVVTSNTSGVGFNTGAFSS